MLKQLDTLIGFVVVMSLVSLLITIITQMVSAALGLRGRNLASALHAMIQKIDPAVDARIRALLVKKVLTHAAVSHSILSMGDSWWDRGPLRRWVSQNWKTASTIRPDEMLGVLQELAEATPDEVTKRWDELRKRLTQCHDLVSLLEAIHEVAPLPNLEQSRQQVAAAAHAADQAVKEAHSNPRNQRLRQQAEEAKAAVSTAIEPSLEALRKRVTDAAQDADRAVRNALVNPQDQTLRRKAHEAKAAMFAAVMPVAPILAPEHFASWRVLSALRVVTPEMQAAIEAVTQALPELAKEKGEAVLHEFNDVRNVALHNLERWFNSAQDRAKQWFAMHTRLCTVLVAIVLAFLLQMDTIQLLQQISSNPELRAGLASLGTNSAFLAQAEKVLDAANVDRVDPAAHHQILADLRQRYPEMKISTNMPADDALASLGTAMLSLTSNVPSPATNSAQWTSLTNEYEQMVERQRLDRLGSAYQQIVNTAQKGGLQLLPDPYPPLFNPRWPRQDWFRLFSGQWSWPMRRLCGIVISAALLSLGAPFWFNLLKSLTSLRPILADQVDKAPRQIPSRTKDK